MPGLVLDTHATIWYLESSPRLSATALAAIQATLSAGDTVFVSTVTVVELIYLVEKRRFPVQLLDRLLAELRRPDAELVVAALDLATAVEVRRVPGTIVRDMPDRMIVATALSLGVPLVTRDSTIQSAGVPVVW